MRRRSPGEWHVSSEALQEFESPREGRFVDSFPVSFRPLLQLCNLEVKGSDYGKVVRVVVDAVLHLTYDQSVDKADRREA